MSRRSGAARPLRPFTTDHFRAWAGLLTLDNGRLWVPEDFQLEIMGEVFAGYREILVLLPTGSYKTTTVAGLGLYHMQFTPDARVPIGAAAKDQAGILYEQAAGFVRRSAPLQKRFKVQDGYRRILHRQLGGVLRVYSASDDTGDGIIPTLPILDELHRHKGHDLYGTWRDKLTKRDGQLVTLSTAGDDDNNPVEVLREAAHKLPNVKRAGRKTVARSKGREFVMIEYALLAEDDPDDLRVVKMANPASQVTLEELRMRRDSPSTKRWQWLRFTCNRRSKGEDSAIQPEDFDSHYEHELRIGRETANYIGLDIGWKIDHAGITPLGWESRDRRLVADVAAFRPPVDENELVRALLDRVELYLPRGVVYDPNAGGTQMVQQLERGEHPIQLEREWSIEIVFIEHSQDNAPMALAAARFDEAWRKGWIYHDGNAECTNEMCPCGGLRGHMLNAIEKPLGGEKFKFDRPSDARGAKRAKYPIDLFTGLLMANSVAEAEEDKPPLDPALYLPQVIG